MADVRDDLALMAAGEAVPAKVQEYASTSMNLATKDEIFSAMVGVWVFELWRWKSQHTKPGVDGEI